MTEEELILLVRRRITEVDAHIRFGHRCAVGFGLLCLISVSANELGMSCFLWSALFLLLVMITIQHWVRRRLFVEHNALMDRMERRGRRG